MNRIVVIGASAGGLQPMRQIISALKRPIDACVFIVRHVGPHRGGLTTILAAATDLSVSEPEAGTRIETANVYVAPPDCHMTLSDGRIWLDHHPKVHHARPAVDPLFISAAKEYGERTIGIILSGGDSDGAEGVRCIKRMGGLAFVQEPSEAECPGMPIQALNRDGPESLPVALIAERLAALCLSRPS